MRTGYARDVSLDDHRLTLEVNLMGPITGMLAALPRFKAQGRGHLFTVCSMTSFVPFPGIASYAAGKHALRAFHHSLALEERDSPLRFTIFHPAAVETPMLEQEALDDAAALAFSEKTYSAEHVAGLIAKAIDEQPSETVMPAAFGRFMRLAAAFPGLTRKLIIDGEAHGRRVQAQRRQKQWTLWWD